MKKFLGFLIVSAASLAGVSLYAKRSESEFKEFNFANLTDIFKDSFKESLKPKVVVNEAIPVEPMTDSGDYITVPEKPVYTGVLPPHPYDPIFKKYGQKYGIDWRLIKGVAHVESRIGGFKNYEGKYTVSSADALGVMQVLCRGFENGYCTNDFPAIRDWKTVRQNPRALLENPDLNIRIGTEILKWNIDRYGIEKGVAVYNKWGARLEKPPFSNQQYVDNVMKAKRSFA